MKLVSGGVVEFVMEFCPKVVTTVGFDAGARAFFGDDNEEMCNASMMQYVQSMGGDVGIVVGCGRWCWWMFGRGY